MITFFDYHVTMIVIIRMSRVSYCRTFVGFLLYGQLHRRLTERINLAQINGHPVELLGDRRFIVRTRTRSSFVSSTNNSDSCRRAWAAITRL